MLDAPSHLVVAGIVGRSRDTGSVRPHLIDRRYLHRRQRSIERYRSR